MTVRKDSLARYGSRCEPLGQWAGLWAGCSQSSIVAVPAKLLTKLIGRLARWDDGVQKVSLCKMLAGLSGVYWQHTGWPQINALDHVCQCSWQRTGV